MQVRVLNLELIEVSEPDIESPAYGRFVRLRRRNSVDKMFQHALGKAVVVEEIGDDPSRYLVLGPDRAGNFLELVVLDRPAGPAVIHVMSMRTKYRRLLDRGR